MQHLSLLMKKWFFLVLLLFSGNLFSQNIAIGQWRSHPSFREGSKLEEVNNSIFCLTKYGIFYLDKDYGSIVVLSKDKGLSDVQAKAIKYNKPLDLIFIGYGNANIDIIHQGKITNVPDLLNYGGVIGIKEINNCDIYKSDCYISTSFGIIKYDTRKNLIVEDYRDINPENATQLNVYDVSIFRDSIYAATEKGLIAASLSTNVNLKDFQNWKYITKGDCRAIDTFHNRLYIGLNISSNGLRYLDSSGLHQIPDTNFHYIRSVDSRHGHMTIVSGEKQDKKIGGVVTTFDSTGSYHHIYDTPNDVLLDKDGREWYADNEYSLLGKKKDGSGYNYYGLNGPLSYSSLSMLSTEEGMVVTAGGFLPDYAPIFSVSGFYIFKNGVWENKNSSSVPSIPNPFFDMTYLVQDPTSKHLFIGSMFNGLMEYYQDKVINIYNEKNSPITYRANGGPGDPNKVTGLALDNSGNLWISNFLAPHPLIVKTPQNKFYSYEVGSAVLKKDLCQLVVDDYNQVWALTSLYGGLVVFNYNNTLSNTSDDKFREFSTGKGNGNLPDAKTNCIVKDKEGQIWVGTDKGVAVFFDPSSAFSKQADATLPFINDGQYGGYLLQTENIKCIAVDGSNRKWIGTRRGVWVVSPDGTKIIHNFTAANSPLFLDDIRTIGIDGKTGEVFIGTSLGICSYRDAPTDPKESFEHVYAYPNPVKPDYDGVIAINGLVQNTSVKITDLNGKLVYETTSQGGTATWDGRSFGGRRANSGVYLVFLADDTGANKMVTKIMIIR